MAGRFKWWRLGAGLYFLINFVGAIYASVMDEEMHMMLHIFLLLLGIAVYAGWRIGRRGKPEGQVRAEIPAERLEYLQQSVDAIALEVERVGEAQRFADKLRAEQGLPPLMKQE